MRTYVALLRGVNVGAGTKFPMQTFRALLGGMGGGNVRTLLQSGNALFEHEPDAPERLAALLQERTEAELGRVVPCVVLEAADLRRVIERNPFDVGTVGAGIAPARFLVTFLSGQVDQDRLEDLDPAAFAPEEFSPGEREIYVHCPNGVHKARLSHAFWEKRLGLTATARNWNTVTRLAEQAGIQAGPGTHRR
jgi:uncharacterized protein (DUF1697 family)